MHLSFFLIFLTTFYMTFVIYIQNLSLANELKGVSKTIIEILGISLPPGQLQDLETALNTYTPPETSTSSDNQEVTRQLAIGVGVITSIAIIVSLIMAYVLNKSIIELIYTNLITIVFIAITDIIILSIFGSFDLLQSTFLVGIATNYKNQEIRDSRMTTPTENCTKIMEDTLDSMFPAFKNVISNFFSS